MTDRLPPLRFHDLRRGCATTLLERGATLREIQAILGHSDLKMASIYSHANIELLRTNAERMQAPFG